MAEDYTAVFFDYKEGADTTVLKGEADRTFQDLNPEIVDGLQPEFSDDESPPPVKKEETKGMMKLLPALPGIKRAGERTPLREMKFPHRISLREAQSEEGGEAGGRSADSHGSAERNQGKSER